MTSTDFSKPHPLRDLDVAFPASVANLMPPYDDALEAWAKTPEAQPFIKLQRTWFFQGLSPDSVMEFKDGIDKRDALRHLKAVQGSFEPKHEHKEAAVAWLLAQWCTAVKAVPA